MPIFTILPKYMLTVSYPSGTNDEAMGVSAADFINTMRAFVTRLLVTDTSAHRVKHICFIVSSVPFVCHIAPKLMIHLVTSILSRTSVTSQKLHLDQISLNFWKHYLETYNTPGRISHSIHGTSAQSCYRSIRLTEYILPSKATVFLVRSCPEYCFPS